MLMLCIYKIKSTEKLTEQSKKNQNKKYSVVEDLGDCSKQKTVALMIYARGEEYMTCGWTGVCRLISESYLF